MMGMVVIMVMRMTMDAERDGLLNQVDEGDVGDRDGEDDYDGKHELTLLSIFQLAVQ